MDSSTGSHHPPAEPEEPQAVAREGPSTVAYRPLSPQMQTDRYAPQAFHARGGMGEVWRATDGQIGREVALKMLRPGREDDRDRFFAEAQITGQLEHPGIVPVHDLGLDKNFRPFYVMKFVHGRTLKEVLDEYHAADPEAGTDRQVQRLRLLEVFIAMCQTVAYAHSRGVIHRDLKPSNIMIGPYGEAVVLDWGLAKVLGHPESPEAATAYVHLNYSGESSETEAGAVLGAAPYMAPEVAEGKAAEADARTDVYLLGATLYEILTGRPPRQGTSKAEMIELARTVAPVPPRQLNREVPRPLEAICLKALARRQKDRYPTPLELAEDVRRYLAGEPVTAYREGWTERAARWVRRHRTAVGRAAAVLLIAALALFGLAMERQLARERDLHRAQEEARKAEEEAREALATFRRLADEARIATALANAHAEIVPYCDPRGGLAAGEKALELADARWGPALERLPLAGDKREEFTAEFYDLLLILAQLRGGQGQGAASGQKMLALLDRAGPLGKPSASYHRLRAEAHRALGKADRAAEEDRLASDPKVHRTALDYYLQGDQKQLRAQQLAALRPGRMPQEEERALVEAAVEHFRRAAELNRKDSWSHFRAGLCLLKLRQWPEALQSFAAFGELQPLSPWGPCLRGLAWANQGDQRLAAAALKEALQLEADFTPARFVLGLVYLAGGQHAQALQEFDRLKQAGPAEVAYCRGLVYLQTRQHAKAEEEFARAVAARQDFVAAHLARAQVHLLQGPDEAVLKDLDGALGEAAGPERRGRLLRLLIAQLPTPADRKAKWPLALKELQRAEQAGNRSAEVYEDLGAGWYHQGEKDKAIESFSQGLKLAPGNARLLMQRATIYVELDRLDPARRDYADVVGQEARTPEERRRLAEAHMGLGYVYACQGAAADAQRAVSRALDVLLHQGINHYLLQHNLACVYAVLARDPGRREADGTLALHFLRRELDEAKRVGARDNALAMIKDEPAFKPDFCKRPEFQKLLETQ
jgi:tRNA A-37 threonylcarbamoyl transferase component Bud32/Tfp pilus assembly protein PilF